MTILHFQKLKISMRYWLLGRNDILALNAMEFANNIHIGHRKDGITPEFQHQIEIAHFLRTLSPSMEYESETLAAIFLHDIAEDYDISFEELTSKFGPIVSRAVKLVTKKYRGDIKNPTDLFNEMAKCPIASILKGADRINNLQSMIGVFSIEKQQKYIIETEEFIIPMLKKARHLHVKQEFIYENIKFNLNTQIKILKANIANMQPKVE